MNTYHIAVNPLDGIGKDIIPLVVELMKKAQRLIGGYDMDYQFYEAGFEYFVKTGSLMPEGFQKEMEAADAMFCGSVGQYNMEVKPADFPGLRTGRLISFFRKGMGNTIGLRPLRLLPGFQSPLRNVSEIDIMLLRELSEGGYMTPGSTVTENAAYDVHIVTRAATEKLARYAFRLSRHRSGALKDGAKSVTVGGKVGAIACLDFYRNVFSQAAADYPDVDFRSVQIDALAEGILRNPETLDVVVCENMLGDIIGDIGAFITGGMGITPTADVGGVTPQFRPNHGTFPRAAGKNFANPLAAIMTAALMLETLGADYEDPALTAAAELIRKAVELNFAESGPRTKDMGGSASSTQVIDAVGTAMERIGRKM